MIGLLSMIFVGQAEFADRLDLPKFRHLKQRVACDVLCALSRCTETAAYIARAFASRGLCGGGHDERSRAVNPQSVWWNSRVISVLCDNALVTGFAVHERQ